jgi:hypothetical protein
MIFVSHNHEDKAIVEQFAVRLRDTFGQEDVFYDSWSIQPGDGIIDKMSNALANCRFFLFFVSKNSLQSKMVELEWQNAIIKATNGQTKFIPVRIDNCLMPPILLQTLYIDLFSNGLEIALRQVVEVVTGQNTFKQGPAEFSNLKAYVYQDDDATLLEIRALHYLEPISSFLILVENDNDEIEFSLDHASAFFGGFNRNLRLQNGSVCNGQLMQTERGTVPGHPFIIRAKPRTGHSVRLIGINHQRSQNQWVPVPVSVSRPERT